MIETNQIITHHNENLVPNYHLNETYDNIEQGTIVNPPLPNEHQQQMNITKQHHTMQTPNTSKCQHGRHTAGANVRREKGNNPDRQLRSQSYG